MLKFKVIKSTNTSLITFTSDISHSYTNKCILYLVNYNKACWFLLHPYSKMVKDSSDRAV